MISVFVCDNMVFRGDLIALNRKHTAGLHLRTELNHAILRFQDHFGRLTGEIGNLKERSDNFCLVRHPPIPPVPLLPEKHGKRRPRRKFSMPCPQLEAKIRPKEHT